MKFLLIGGSGFIGPHLVKQLVDEGHEATVFHRGVSKPEFPSQVKQLLGDRNRLPDYKNVFEQLRPDVVVDLVLSSGEQAKGLALFEGIAGRLVVLSSQDAYRAYGILLGRDDAPIQPTPLTEESELRSYKPYDDAHLAQMQSVFSWLNADYDKVDVERVVMKELGLPATVLRLPMIYGPGDPLHRLFPILKRIDDGRKTILLDETIANFKAPRGYVEDVAHAILLASVCPKAVGQIYNVVECDQFSELDWTKKVASVAGWQGEVKAIAVERVPKHLRMPLNTRQTWLVSSQKIRQELSYKERIPRDKALKKTIEWERVNPPKNVTAEQFDYAAEDAALVAPAAKE